MTAPLADAALLAAGAPEGGVLDPTDESVEAAYLDLREDSQDVALYKTRLVGVALGPRLYLQERLRLVIACGELPLHLPAAALAEKFPAPPEGGGPMIATVHGEDLFNRLEELMVAGCEFRSESSGLPLREDEWPHTAWAPAGPAVVAKALVAGARVVIARFVTPETVSAALAAADEGLPVAEQPTGDVLLKFSNGVELKVVLPLEMNADWFENRLPEGIRARCTLEQTNDARLLTIVSAKDDWSLFEIARHITLAAPAGTLRHPLYEQVVWKFEESRFAVPAKLLEFGYDLRPASEWLES